MSLVRIYDKMIIGLAALGACSLAFMTFAVVSDAMLRNLGLRPFQATSAITEYIMLFATMSAAPWLVRDRGHVAIGSFTAMFSPMVRRTIGRLVLVLCILTLSLLCWRSAAMTIEVTRAGAVDMRSINIPAGVLYAMLCGGFGLTAIEFLRLLVLGKNYDAAGGEF